MIYSDDLRDLLKQGRANIRRVSTVEPTEDGRWQADLSPVGGPILEACETRQEALNNEVQWLEHNIL
jgi:hypothetical protein